VVFFVPEKKGKNPRPKNSKKNSVSGRKKKARLASFQTTGEKRLVGERKKRSRCRSLIQGGGGPNVIEFGIRESFPINAADRKGKGNLSSSEKKGQLPAGRKKNAVRRNGGKKNTPTSHTKKLLFVPKKERGPRSPKKRHPSALLFSLPKKGKLQPLRLA